MKKMLAALAVAALCGAAAADTWYVIAGTKASDVATINDLSLWTNSVGEVGSGAPTTDDYQVIPAGITYRVGNLTSKSRSVTLCGNITHDGSAITWANDGLFLRAGSKYWLNTYIAGHPFSDMRTISLNGTFTTLSESSSSPAVFQHQQMGYSNQLYKVQRLAGAVGTYVKVNNAGEPVNVAVEFTDASAFKGSLTASYSSDAVANNHPPLDSGEYGERVSFGGLDTPGKLTIGKNWVLGALTNGVTRAAEVELGNGARVEAMLSEGGVSRLDVTTTLTLGTGVQIFVLGDNIIAPIGRFPVLTAPVALDASSFILKKAPRYSALIAELEADYADGVGTLYLKISGYQARYVDAENGDDSWDGTTNAIPDAATIALGGAIPGPRRTLAAAVADAMPGGTIYAAEGSYAEGGMYFADSYTSNRVIVPKYVTLEAAGAKERTFIRGHISTDPGNVGGCFTNAMRCVCLRTGAVVKGFTLADGRTHDGGSDTTHCNGGAACGYRIGTTEERGLLTDCVITNCGSAKRGPNFHGPVTLLRCVVHECSYHGDGYEFYSGARVIDSIIRVNTSCYRNCQFVNCTFPTTTTIFGNGATERSYLRNCLHLGGGSSSRQGRSTYVYNSYFCTPVTTTADDFYTDDLSRYSVPLADLPYGVTSCRPSAKSIAVGKGDLAMYLASTNGWPSTMRRQFTMKDIYGTDRLNGGALDLGAVQHCDRFRYVDAVNGDDAQDGLTAATAKRTLKAMMTSLEAENDYADTVVRAAPGVYEEGEMFYASCSNRVVVLPYVGIEAVGGPSVTTIKGRFGDLSNNSKAGAEAVRCVYLRTGAWVKGFKITGGSTQQSGSNAWGCRGGGVYSDGGAAVACEITGNAGGGEDTNYRGPGGFGGVYIGCYVHDNYGNFQIYVNGSPKAVVAANSVMTGSNAFYSDGDLLNCTVYASANGLSWAMGTCHAWNCFVNESGRGRAYTNCFFKAATFAVINNNGVPGNTYDPETCRFGVSQSGLDAGFLPLAESVFVDAGSLAYYNAYFPAKWGMFKDVGFLGQQRVYNGAIDVGGGEYDVRGDFAKKLNGDNKLTVDAVAANATAAANGVTLAAGDSIEMTFEFAATGTARFTVSGDVTVTVDGAPLAPVDGVYMVNGTKGASHAVKVTNTGSTTATLNACDLPLDGLRIIFK